MAVEFYQRVRQLFEEALEHADSERMPFLQAACTGDPTLLQAVEQLLRARNSPALFLETAPAASASETRIGRFLIRGELGRGAMGVVYDAIDPLIGRSVAVKVIHLDSSTETEQAEFLKERLFREARSAGQLFHPGIVVILDVGQQGDTAFIAMERVEGKSLLQTLSTGPPIDIIPALEILRQTAAALDYAHGRGVVHRDIKPANIMLQDGGTIKIADFGIAKIMSAQQATVTGVVMGTPSYMSPEQIESQPVNGRADQFSLAVVGFELLTGTRPFQSDSIATLTYMIVHGNRPSARTANPRLPESVDEVFRTAFARQPEGRYPTCTRFVEALTAALNAPIQSVPEVMVKKPRSRAPFYLMALAAVAMAAGASWFLFSKYAGPEHISPVVPPPVRAHALPPVMARAPLKAPAPKRQAVVPVIQRFQADPPSIELGMSTKLSWSATGATETKLDHDIGPVPHTGTLVVSPLSSSNYELTATGASSEIPSTVEVHSTVSVEVKPKAERPRRLYEDAVEKRRNGLLPEALALLHQAAAAGSSRAMVDLGEYYRDGQGVTKDVSQAARWFRRAAEAGNAPGMVFLGYMYQEGEGVEKSDTEAVKWFQKAADHGNSSGLYNLATKYERGEGVRISAEKAVELYEKAADMGNIEARRRLHQLNRRK
jgi:serine/threonine protein kinase